MGKRTYQLVSAIHLTQWPTISTSMKRQLNNDVLLAKVARRAVAWWWQSKQTRQSQAPLYNKAVTQWFHSKIISCITTASSLIIRHSTDRLPNTCPKTRSITSMMLTALSNTWSRLMKVWRFKRMWKACSLWRISGWGIPSSRSFPLRCSNF